MYIFLNIDCKNNIDSLTVFRYPKKNCSDSHAENNHTHNKT